MVAMGYTPGEANHQGQLRPRSVSVARSRSSDLHHLSQRHRQRDSHDCIPTGPANDQFHWLVLNVVPSFFGGTVPTPSLSATGSMRCNG